VSEGKVHWYIGGGLGAARGGPRGARRLGSHAGPGAESTAEQIQRWVTSHFEPTTVDGVTLYDLTT
jgi:hypothetical protein